MIRVCPKRDTVCPHGMSCPYTIDRYSCKSEPKPPAEVKAAIIAEIHLGVAMARAAGVECGSPTNIQIN
jgi:hypothetical protein